MEKSVESVKAFSQEEENFKSLAEERNRTQKLTIECTNLHKKLQEHKTHLNTLLQKRETLLQNIEDITTKSEDFFKVNIREQLSLYKSVKLPEQDDLNENLQNYCCLLGFQLTNFEYQDDQRLFMRLHYNNDCFVDLERNEFDNYILNAIEPMPPLFQDIKDFLEKTQDVQGLFINVRKYFSQLTKQEEKEKN